MRWLIDGYNVIRNDADLRGREEESLEAGRRALLHLLAQSARTSGDDFVVVFDGARVTGPGPSAGRVQVLFSRPPRTADDELMRLARQQGAGAVVVTSDRKVRDAARRAGAAVVTSEQFLRRASEGPEDPATKIEEDELPRDKRGNPHRLSKEARAARRALRRLRPS
ncbi:MAG TPA: NYN domain-containing protein [Methylomirabilota bacterium]|nr:NYN domain-containing protein [Methylomirabilota bacterium]